MTLYYAPLGDEAGANTITAGVQTRPQAAALASGGYVVVWEDASGSADDPGLAIRGQMFDSGGDKVGAEFLVDTITAGDQSQPSVAAMPSGGFVVTWTGSDSSGTGIKGQLYTPEGVKSGAEFQANTSTSGDQSEARAVVSFGGFAVVWFDHSATGTAIRGQLFTAAGAKSGAEFLIAPESAHARGDLSAAQVSDGSNDARLVVTWTEANGDSNGNDTAAMAQVVNYYGERFGSAFPVSQTAAGDQLDAAVAAYHHPLSDGFVVAYVDSADADGEGAVTVRIFDAKGKPTSADIRLTEPGSGAHDPSVLGFESGLLAVSWNDSAGHVQVQVINATGETLGAPIEATGAGALASLVPLGAESFIAVWADGDIQTRAFAPAGPAVADIALSDSRIGEAVPANLTVAELGATGIGGSSGFSYALLGDSSGGAFTLEGNRLVLANPSLIDFETAEQVELTVRATDSDGHVRDETFVLDVANAAVEPQGWTASDPFAVKDAPYGPTKPSVAPLASGGFVMVYADYSAPGGDSSSPMRGQVFSETGEKVGDEFKLVSADNGSQPPLVAGLADGGFVVLFSDQGATQGGALDLFTQRFDPAGHAVGDRVRVGSGADGQTGNIAALPAGGFVVTYTNASAPFGQNNLFAQMYDQAGHKSGAAFAVPTGSQGGSHPLTDVATLAEGGFVVTWHDNGTFIVYGQRFDAAGTQVGTTFRVDAAGDPNFALDASVTGLAGGGFVISWSERIPYHAGETDPWSVKAQIFDPAGAKVGGEFVVNSDAVAEQRLSAVTPLAGGGFMVVWNEHVSRPDVSAHDSFGGVTRAQMFDAAGNRIGGEFALDDGFTQTQYYTAAATLSWGGVVVAYGDLGASAGPGDMVRARLLSPGTLDAHADSVVALESSGAAGSLFADNGSGADFAPADGRLIVGEVNGSAANVGETITLASGARLTVNSDGTFNYDTNHAFDSLAAYGSGGSNSLGHDSFTYKLVAGDTAMVDLSIRGEYSTPHIVQGSAGADSLIGASGPDSLMLQLGGDDVVHAGAGNDLIFFGAALTAADIVDGGAGVDTLIVQGDYAGGLTLTANVTNIENLSILAGTNTNIGAPGTELYDYVITTNDANFAAGVQVRVNAGALLPGEDFTFDGRAETDASFVVYGGRGVDTLLGGLGNDIFFFAEKLQFAPGDTVDGGVGYDSVYFRGNYTIDFNAPGYAGQFNSIESMTLTSAGDTRYARGGPSEFDYSIALADANLAAGVTLTVNGTLLQSFETMVVDGSQESDGFLRIFAGSSDDTIKGGGQADLIHGNLGADTITGGGGADTFRYQKSAESTSSSMDHILDFTPGTDKIELTRMDANTLAAGNQDFHWIGSDAFAGSGAASAGELRGYEQSGTWFVEGDTNGDGTADLVIALTLQGQTPLGQNDFFL
ncbi:MAG: M10 family metallopeptidase C-terminal domain-containing protein [Allosphingosinicella sp.]